MKGARVCYVTSMPIAESTIEYFLRIISTSAQMSLQDIKSKVFFVCCYDESSKKTLSQKILERPLLLQKIKKWVRPTAKSYIQCFISSNLEKEISEQLAIPLFASPWEISYWGTKAGSKKLFKKLNLPQVAPQDVSESFCNSEQSLAENMFKLYRSGIK